MLRISGSVTTPTFEVPLYTIYQGEVVKWMNSAQWHSKQSQIVQNFFSKTTQIIAEARLSPDDLRADEFSSSSVNKWFNLELKELAFLRDNLRPWRHISLDDPPPPLAVECFLNSSKLLPGQTVVLGDSRCSTNQDIVLERWIIEFKPVNHLVSGASDEDSGVEDLPAVYKRAIVSIRSLYTAVRLLPSWQLHQKLCRQKLISVPLKLGIRVQDASLPINSRGRIGLSKTIADKRSTLQQFRIQPISMPVGSLHCSATYRTDVRFGVEDIEKVMAQKFIELDAPTTNPTTSSEGGTSNPSSLGLQLGSQLSLGPRPMLNFTRPFKSPESGNAAPSSIPNSVNSQGVVAPQSISGSASSVVSANSRFSSSFAFQRAQALPNRSVSHESHLRASVTNSTGSDETSHVGSELDPGSGLYMAQSDVGDFVKFVDETRKRGPGRVRQQSTDAESALARYQTMRSSFVQLSDSIMQGSTHQETLRPDRRRSSGPRSRLGFYSEQDDDDDGDSDLLFTLSDMHI